MSTTREIAPHNRNPSHGFATIRASRFRGAGAAGCQWLQARIAAVTAVAAPTAESSTTRARAIPLHIQTDAAAVGAELFHTPDQMPTGKEDTALLAFMFRCARPHFFWNCLGHATASMRGDWLDG